MTTALLTDRYGGEWAAVQPFANTAAFPAAGVQGILYVDASVDPNQGYRWDDALASYVLIGSTGSTCPAPMTRAALLALRNAGGLSKDCDYVVTDHVQGRLVAGTTIHLQAVDASTLSENAAVKTPYDNEAWAGVYDLDRGLVLELTDNRGNVAKGVNGVEVFNFDWGNASYTNVVVDNATLIADIGNPATKENLVVRQRGTLNLTGFTGIINNFVVENFGVANFTNANGTWRLARVADNTQFNCSGYTGGGDNYCFEALHNSAVNFSGRSSQVVLRTTNLYNTTVNAAGVTSGQLNITSCPLLDNSTIKHVPGAGALSLTRVEMHGQAAVTNNAGGGALTLNNCSVRSGAFVAKQNAGSLTLSQCEVSESSSVYNYGTGAVSHTRLRAAQNSQVYLEAGSTIGMTTTNTIVEGQSQVRSVGAVVGGTLTLSNTRVAANSLIYKRAAHTGNLSITQSELHGSSGIDAQSGTRSYNITRLRQSEVSRAVFTGTGAVTDTLADINMSTRGGLTVSCSGPANSLLYSSISGLSGSIVFAGTTGGQACSGLKVDDGVINFNNCTANLNMTLCSARDLGQINCQNMAVSKSLQYLDADSNSTMIFSAATGGGTVTRVKTSAGAGFQQNGAAGAASNVAVFGGTLNQNGGSLSNITKGGSGTLTTGAFAHDNVVYISNTGFTMTAANNSRARYTGLGNAAYAPTGSVI